MKKVALGALGILRFCQKSEVENPGQYGSTGLAQSGMGCVFFSFLTNAHLKRSVLQL